MQWQSDTNYIISCEYLVLNNTTCTYNVDIYKDLVDMNKYCYVMIGIRLLSYTLITFLQEFEHKENFTTN